MDNNSNWRPQTPSQGRGGAGGDAQAAADDVDWRAQLGQSSRDRIINKILETLKKRLPVSGPEGLNELKKIAVKFEEKIYHGASSQSNYLSRISLKMLAMETSSQNTIPNALTSNSDVSINKLSDIENISISLEDLTNGAANLDIKATSSSDV